MYQKREISLPLGYKTARPKTVDFEWPDVLARILVPFLTSITLPYIITPFTCKSITGLQLYSLRTKTPMTGRIWKTKVTAAPIQLRTTGGSYKTRERYVFSYCCIANTIN